MQQTSSSFKTDFSATKSNFGGESTKGGPKHHDWVAGWEPHPLKAGCPRFTFGASGRGRGRHDEGFRDTYVTIYSRNLGHVPGPGAHRAPRELPLLDGGDKHKGTLHSGRHVDFFSCTLGNTKQSKELKETVHGKTHLKDGEDLDMRRTIFSKSANFTMIKTPYNRSLSDLRQAKRSSLPTSFQSPGPGAYTQHSCFGIPSGGTRKSFLGTRSSDNCGNETRSAPNLPIASHKVGAKRPKIKVSPPALETTLKVRVNMSAPGTETSFRMS